jgi:hypothetical protein
MNPVPRGHKHFINAPFILVLLVIIVLGAHEGVGAIWPYIPLLLIFSVQFARPTIAGWWLTEVSWVLLALGVPAYYRFVLGRSEFNNWFLLLWGMLPLVVLWLLGRRKQKKGADSLPYNALFLGLTAW